MELEKIFLQLLNMSITAGYVIVAVLAVRLLIRRLPKIYSYILWSIVAFRLLCPISFSSAFSFFNLNLFENIEKEQGLQYVVVAEYDTANQINPVMVNEMVINTKETAMPAVENTGAGNVAAGNTAEGIKIMGIKEMIPQIAAIIWILGIGFLLIYTIIALLKIRKQTATAVLLYENIYECEGIHSPFVYGILRPRIYIPFRLQDEEREYILGHEKHHVQRKDYLIKAAAYLIAVVYWFSPLVWLSYYLMCQDMEMSCDEKVIGGMGKEVKQDYSRLLLSFATGRRKLAGPLYFGESNVGKRIKNILKYKKAGIAAASLGVVLLIVLCLIFATDGRSKNSIRVTMTDEAPVLSSTIPMEESVRHEYTLEDNIKSYLVYGDIYREGVYLGRKIIACHDVSNYHEDFAPMTSINITSQGEETEVMFMYNTDMLSRTESFYIPEKATMWAADVLWDDGEKREIVPEKPYIYEAKYIGGNDTEHLECFRCENLNEASAEEWDNCINQNCTTILLSFVFSEKLEQDLLKEYKSDNEAYLMEGIEEEASLQQEKAANKENSREDNGQPELSLTQVMDRVVEECWDTEDIDDFNIVLNELKNEEKNLEINGYTRDRMVLLARSEDSKVTAYGIISPEYGSKGIVMDFENEGDSHNHNYFEWDWDPYRFRPWIEKADLDSDGRDEVLFFLNGAVSEDTYQERLIIFETYETCHMEPYELMLDYMETDIERLLKTEIRKDSRTVDILDGETGNTVISGISYDAGTEVEFSKMDYTSNFRFLYDKNSPRLFLRVRPGIVANNSGKVIFAEEEIAFLIDYSEDMEGGHFTLTNPSLYQESAYYE